MLTLFIMASNNRGIDRKRTIDSLGDLVASVKYADILAQVNREVKITPWYIVLYDNEYIDEELRRGLRVFLDITKADVLVLWKREMMGGEPYVTKSPRVFRSHVQLEEGQLLPRNIGLKVQTVLDGWILPNG